MVPPIPPPLYVNSYLPVANATMQPARASPRPFPFLFLIHGEEMQPAAYTAPSSASTLLDPPGLLWIHLQSSSV